MILVGKIRLVLQEMPDEMIFHQIPVALVYVQAFHTNAEHHFTKGFPVIDKRLVFPRKVLWGDRWR